MKILSRKKKKHEITSSNLKDSRMNLKRKTNDAYSLRNRQKQKPIKPKSSKKTKTTSAKNNKTKKNFKSEPLSKYRRKNANARERSRMKDLNFAYEKLRNCVPTVKEAESVSSERLTKITTLKLAMNYISALNELLAQTDYLVKTSDSMKLREDICHNIQIDHSYTNSCKSFDEICDDGNLYDDLESEDEDLIKFSKFSRFPMKSNLINLDSEGVLQLNLSSVEISKPYSIPLETENNLNPLLDLFSEISEGYDNLISI